MTKLNDYHHFSGRHWETGSVCNYLAYRGVTAPHSGQPYSEALLLGISGGIVMGYFSFAYHGYDPHVALLTRNTFDPLETLLQRLGVEQEILQTSLPEKGLANLLSTLESGLPALTWVDIFSLPYFGLPNDDDMYVMYPVLVYGYEEEKDLVWIADHAEVGLTVTTGELAKARARVKKDKFRVLTISAPNPDRLVPAVKQGIADTLQLFTGLPPKGSRENFGFAAYQRWRELLIKPKMKSSWASVFPPGQKMVAGLVSAFLGTIQNYPGCGGERDTYADFLVEASSILGKPGLQQAAAGFHEAAQAWEMMGKALLPDEIDSFGRIRRLMLQRKVLFRTRGGAAQVEIQRINAEIKGLKLEASQDFPLSGSSLHDFIENLRARIQDVHDVEQQAVKALENAMAS
jgi:hypothetical protein